MKTVITTNIYGLTVHTHIDELKNWYDILIEHKTYLSRAQIALVILHATTLWNGENAANYDMFEDRSNEAIISARVLPKLLQRKIVRLSGCRTIRYLMD